jgi:hypothetical protein
MSKELSIFEEMLIFLFKGPPEDIYFDHLQRIKKTKTTTDRNQLFLMYIILREFAEYEVSDYYGSRFYQVLNFFYWFINTNLLENYPDLHYLTRKEEIIKDLRRPLDWLDKKTVTHLGQSAFKVKIGSDSPRKWIEFLCILIIHFWEYGYNIVGDLFMILNYTNRFFSLNDVTKSISCAEYELEMNSGILQKDWNDIYEALKEKAHIKTFWIEDD